MSSPRFLVGIDLGTTNTVVAYCENNQDLKNSPIQLFEIDQLIGPGEVARRPLLPSFRYHFAHHQFSHADLQLPWNDMPVKNDIPHTIIGEWARELGAQTEGRQVSSAKSWLSHKNVDREEAILPWASKEDIEKVSPVMASASYLNHIRQAWNYHHPYHILEDQEVVVTVPASFDETARKLTLQAAHLAGLSTILLLEEPQAACYDWYARHHQDASEQLKDIPLILVADVGGGTTDLSLISALDKGGELALDRIGVGEHLMLGGDNIDLAIAHTVEHKLNQGQKFNVSRLHKLIQQTRKAKETLLSVNAPESAKITLLGSGSRLIGGSKSIPLTKADAHQLVFEGFFPLSDYDVLPEKKRNAMIEFGLPYVADPSVTKHIAEFLHEHHTTAAKILRIDDQTRPIPAGLLLNGGVFNSPLLKTRMTELLSAWRGAPITVLDNPHPDWAVALGAVAYAKARRGAQLKIGGGAARSYFLHLQEKNKKSKALCILAKGTEEGQEIRLTSRRFALTLNEPVRFNLLTATADTILHEQAIQNGLLTDVDQDRMLPLPPYITELKLSDQAEQRGNQKQREEVYLASQLTPVGTLKLECVSVHHNDKRWQVEFEVRRKAEQHDANIDLPKQFEQAKNQITRLYSGNKQPGQEKAIKTLGKDLEKYIGKKESWNSAVARQLFDVFAQGRKRRRRSDLHEKNWFRLAGFCMRPGFGDATDPWRIELIWPLYEQSIQFPSHQSWSDWWVFWRRVSGGLNQEQQERILADIAKYLHPSAAKNPKLAKEAKDKDYEGMVRLAASLEHLEVEDKTLLANWFLNKALKETLYNQAHWWALARLGARGLAYGSNHKILSREQVEQWLLKILTLDWSQEPMAGFACVMLSRKTGDRLIDISADVREQVIEKLKRNKVPNGWLALVTEIKALSENDTKKVFGDALPNGLMLLKASAD